MGMSEVCGREIVSERQICKPPEQLVSSFHSDKKNNNNSNNNKADTSPCF